MFKIALVATAAVAGANPLKKVYKPPVKTCPKGFSLQGKQCLSRRFEDEVLACSSGILAGEWCESSAEATKACPTGWTLSGKSCLYTASVPAEAVCYNGYVLQGDVCISWNEVDLVPSCNVGTLHGGACLVEEEDIPRYECDGEFHKGECYRMETYECPSKKSSYGRYLGKKRMRGAGYYPFSYTMPAYSKKAPVYHTKKAPAPALCTRKVAVEMQPICADGFTLFDDMCSRTTSYAPDYICPVGGDGKGCYEKTETAPGYRCPAGYDDNKSGCWRTETQDAVYECAEGELHGTECLLYTEPSSYCVNGTANGKGQCLIESFAEPIVTPSKKGSW